MEKATITLRTLAPVVLTASSAAGILTESEDYILGSVLRGIFADRYIRQQRLLPSKAHENEDFFRLFFRRLRFVDAYPAGTIPIPASLMKNKAGDRVVDLLCPHQPEDIANYKRWTGIMRIIEEDGDVSSASVGKTVFLHMSRNTSEERILGRSIEGHIYNYEAIDAGEEFEGQLIGEKEDINALFNALRLDGQGRMSCVLGRSKFTQYGKCELSVSAPEELCSLQPDGENRIFVRLHTPLLVRDSFSFCAVSALRQITAILRTETGAQDIVLDEDALYASIVPINNFVGVWGMKRPRVNALAAGTVFQLRKDSAWQREELDVLQRIMFSGELSLRSEEGFGQMRQWNPRPLRIVSKQKKEGVSNAPLDDIVKKQARTILDRWSRKQARMRAALDADTMAKENNLEKKKGMFSRLEDMLKEKDGRDRTRHAYIQILLAEVGQATFFGKHLKETKVNGVPLREMLEAGIPETVVKECRLKGGALAEEIGYDSFLRELPEKLFPVYWQAFFQHARKQLAEGKEDA